MIVVENRSGVAGVGGGRRHWVKTGSNKTHCSESLTLPTVVVFMQPARVLKLLEVRTQEGSNFSVVFKDKK